MALLYREFSDLKELSKALKKVEELRQQGIKIEVRIITLNEDLHELKLRFDDRDSEIIAKAFPNAVVLA